MDNIYVNNKSEIKVILNEIWDYMKLNQPLEKCNLIIGCGCSNLDIPVRCSELLKNGLCSIVMFAGGLGKRTKDNFNKSEAEIYRDIALENGIDINNILIENKSTNTGDNFRFAIKILKEKGIKADRILIVHQPFSERRTLTSAIAILGKYAKSINITSPAISFEEYFNKLDKKPLNDIIDEISVIVGDIQRMIIYPQFGWQIEQEVPESIKEKYYYLKALGFSKYILSKEQIRDLIDRYGIIENYNENYFY